MDAKRCFVFAAGSHYGLLERPAPGDFTIAADGGYRICQEEGLTPDLLLGDFDSLTPQGDFAHLRRLPVEKDDTDTLAALKVGLEAGCECFHIYGGTGGKRLDHTLANLQALLFLRRRGARGFLYGDGLVWTVLEDEELVVPRTVEWGLLSVFCLGDRAEGVTEEGVQYPLQEAVLTPDFPLGVSNHILEPRARVAVRRGALAIAWEYGPSEIPPALSPPDGEDAAPLHSLRPPSRGNRFPLENPPSLRGT